MKKFNFDFIPQPLRRWALPLVAVGVMLLLGYWFEFARFLLFAHHLFWIVGGFLLINPVFETFWPDSKHDKLQPAPSQPPKAKRQARARNQAAKHKPPASETATERLARLLREKEKVDRELEKSERK